MEKGSVLIMSSGNYYAMTNLNVYKRITITIADAFNNYVEGRDLNNQPIKIGLGFFYNPFFQMPNVGEDWVVKKIDNNWTLYGKYENEDQLKPVTELQPGDARIESSNNLFLNANEEIIIDFNKAVPSLNQLGTATLPGSALFGSGTLNQFSAGTLITTNKFITPLRTSLSTANVADGQEERYQNDSADGIVWNFRYDADDATTYKWHFIGGPPHLHFVSEGTATTGTAWFDYGGSPSITIPYTGEYVLSGGAECIASANNMGFNLGLSINGSVPASTLSAFASVKDTPVSVNTTYYVVFNAGDVLTEVYRKDPNNNPSGTATFFNRWMSVTPIRVTT